MAFLSEEHLRIVIDISLAQTSKDPVVILNEYMKLPFCPMHGPMHHTLVGAALLTAFRNANGRVHLEEAILELYKRAEQVPGGACGNWGSCGAGISTGMVVAILSGSGPLAKENWKLTGKMTVKALDYITDFGGPRCCKRDSYRALTAAVEYINEHFGVDMQLSPITCSFHEMNPQCIGDACPFHN